MSEKAIITRHGDKGSWKIDESELKGKMSEPEATLVLEVLRNEFPDMKETPLKLDGLVRSLRLGDKVFDEAP